MDNTTVRPSLVLPLDTYRDYFSRAETNTFCSCYASVFRPYHIEIEKSATTVSPQEVARQKYATAQEDVLTAFLQWHKSAGGRGNQIALLHYVSSYAFRIGIPPSPWDEISFASKGKVTYGAVRCAN